MEAIIKKLQPYFKRRKDAEVQVRPMEYDSGSYGLYYTDTGELAREIGLTEDGQLRMYAEYDLEENPLEEMMTKEQIRDMTDRFLADIFPELSSNLHLSTIADLAVFYVLDYCQKDTRFGWEMPNSGVSFCVYKNGMIMDMTNEVGSFSIEYPSKILPAEKAREIYLADLRAIELIVQYDEETFLNGDGQFKLVFDFNSVAMDVKMDGTKTTIDEISEDQQMFENIPALFIKAVSPFTLAGVEGMEKIAEAKSEVGLVEVWSHFPLEHFEGEYKDTDLMDIDSGIDDLVKFVIDQKNGKLIRMVKGIGKPADNFITAEEAYPLALNILSRQFTNAHQAFKLRREEPAITDYDDEDEVLPPYAYCFTFNRFEKDVQIDGVYIDITIDANTGELLEIYASEYAFSDFSEIGDSNPGNFAKARTVYEQLFTMKLQWAKELVDETGKYQYNLVYMPDFKDASGHVLYVDAHTLEPWIVDVTGLEEF